VKSCLATLANALLKTARVSLAAGHTDMRDGFDGLALLVPETLKRDGRRAGRRRSKEATVIFSLIAAPPPLAQHPPPNRRVEARADRAKCCAPRIDRRRVRLFAQLRAATRSRW
jgi:hypothetical protein